MKLFFRLGVLALCAAVLVHGLIHWEWSLLMDDVSYNTWMPKVTDLFEAFNKEISDYWAQGRFYPVKYLANLLKWKYLPPSPDVFHWFDFFLLVLCLVIGASAILSMNQSVVGDMAAGPAQMKDNPSGFKWIVILVGFGFLQRPLLDVAALNSIAEGWVILFFVLGFWAFSFKHGSYRIFLVMCALSKEPGSMALLGTSVAHGYTYLKSQKQKKEFLVSSLIDGVLFLFLAIVALEAKRAGPYLAGYSLVSKAGLKFFIQGLGKCLIGLIPLVFLGLMSMKWNRIKEFFGNKDRIGQFLVLIVFSVGYLFLVSGRNAAGYLLAPVAMGFYLIVAEMTLHSVVPTEGPQPRLNNGIVILFLILFVGSLSVSLYRYSRFAEAINGPTRSITHILERPEPILILINGDEAAHQGNIVATSINSTSRLEVISDEAFQKIATFKGRVVLFELSSYFGAIPQRVVDRVSSLVGGWEQVENEGVYRVFYAHGP